MAQLPDAALDVRVAFGLLEFFLDLLQRHLLPLEPLPVLEQIVGVATTASIATTVPISCSDSVLVTVSIDRRIDPHHGVEPVPLRPEHQRP